MQNFKVPQWSNLNRQSVTGILMLLDSSFDIWPLDDHWTMRALLTSERSRPIFSNSYHWFHLYPYPILKSVNYKCISDFFKTFSSDPCLKFHIKFHSEPIRFIAIHPEIWIWTNLNSSKSNPVNRRFLIRMNPDQFFNPDESGVGIIRNDLDWEFSLNHSDRWFTRIKNFVRIHSDWKAPRKKKYKHCNNSALLL